MIADILFEVAWKSTIVAACLVALLYAMHRQAASNRVAVGGLGFLLLLTLPAVVLVIARLPVPVIEMASPAPETIAALPLAMPETALAALPPSPVDPNSQASDSRALLMFLWAAGALIFLLRLGAGLLTLQSWTRRADPFVAASKLQDMLRRCGVSDTARIYVSTEISAPLSWGWRKPVILIDRDTLAKPIEAEAVIAHEAAHLVRGDWPRLIAARLVVAMFWFNPFVWLLERLYLQDVEEAADAEATSFVEPAHYAQALLNAARNASVPVGANSIASGSLAKRIKRVLSGRAHSRWDRALRVGALVGVGLIAAPIALIQFVAPAVSEAAPIKQLAPVATLRAAVASVVAAPAAPVAVPSLTPPAAAPTEPVTPVTAPRAAPVLRILVPSAPTAPLIGTLTAVHEAPTAPRIRVISKEEIERIKRDTSEIRARSVIVSRDAQAIAERARQQAAVAMANARVSMMRGADEMERGAIQMREGAATMREEARKLRDPAYRAKVIAEAEAKRARGWGGKWDYKVPTDQELIDAIPKMEKGADKMEAGVENMREGARQMRESAQKQD